jgi:hypothetical protein
MAGIKLVEKDDYLREVTHNFYIGPGMDKIHRNNVTQCVAPSSIFRLQRLQFWSSLPMILSTRMECSRAVTLPTSVCLDLHFSHFWSLMLSVSFLDEL